MEQKAKKYTELNKYEQVMVNATFEQKIEAIANELKQMAYALGTSIHVDATFHNWQAQDDENETHATVIVYFPQEGKGECLHRSVTEAGDLFGIIEEVMNKRKQTEE